MMYQIFKKKKKRKRNGGINKHISPMINFILIKSLSSLLNEENYSKTGPRVFLHLLAIQVCPH